MTSGDSIKKNSAIIRFFRAFLHEVTVFHYVVIFLVLATLVVSSMALINTNQLKKALIPKTVSVSDFLQKLTQHSELKNYAGVTPINVVQVNSNNLAGLQAQINGLDTSYIGDYIIQYKDKIAIYDYNNDKIKGNVNIPQTQQAPLPTDFFAKLNKHAEIQGLQSQQPVGGPLDAISLNTLKQQFPDTYANAREGDFLLRYQTKLIIYDYNNDKVINAVNLK